MLEVSKFAVLRIYKFSSKEILVRLERYFIFLGVTGTFFKVQLYFVCSYIKICEFFVVTFTFSYNSGILLLVFSYF